MNGNNPRRSIWEMLQRADSGLNRLIISFLFILLSFVALFFAYKLVLMGVKGEFAILSEYKGLKLYIFSLSPGLAFLVFGFFIIWPGLSATLKSIYYFKQGQK